MPSIALYLKPRAQKAPHRGVDVKRKIRKIDVRGKSTQTEFAGVGRGRRKKITRQPRTVRIGGYHALTILKGANF